MEISQSNIPLIVISADLCEYAIAPLDTSFAASYIKDPAVIPALPMELTGALLEKTLASYIENVSIRLNTKIDITSYAPLSSASKYCEYIDFSFNLEDKGINLPLRLYFKNESSISRFLERTASLDREQHLSESMLSMHFEKIIGTQSFSFEELHSLESGDAVFLERNYYAEKKIVLKSDRTAYIIDIGENGETTISAAEYEYQFEGSPKMPNNEETSLDKLSLDVEFSLGAKDMTVEDLRQLTPGVSVDLGELGLSNIALKVNGQTIGYGQLIQINDQYAVQISRINNG